MVLEILITSNRGRYFLSVSKTGDMEQRIDTVIGIFHQMSVYTSYRERIKRLTLQITTHQMPFTTFR